MEKTITETDLVKLSAHVENNRRDIGYLKERTDKHSKKINDLEDNHIALPLAIQEAVSKGMAPVLEKLLRHDEEFTNLKIAKEREEKEQVIKQLEEDAERKRWFTRSVLGVVITAIVSPAVAYFIWFLMGSK